MSNLLLFFVKLIFKKEVEAMAVVYATLVVKGLKKIEDIPAVIRPKVQEILAALEV